MPTTIKVLLIELITLFSFSGCGPAQQRVSKDYKKNICEQKDADVKHLISQGKVCENKGDELCIVLESIPFKCGRFLCTPYRACAGSRECLDYSCQCGCLSDSVCGGDGLVCEDCRCVPESNRGVFDNIEAKRVKQKP